MHTQTTHTRTYTILSQLCRLFKTKAKLAGAMDTLRDSAVNTLSYTTLGRVENPPKYYIHKNGKNYDKYKANAIF